MKIRKIIIICVLLAIFTMGAVSASDSNATDVVTVGQDTANLEMSEADTQVTDAFEDIQTTSNTFEETRGATISVTGHTFADIQKAIDSAHDRDTIVLSGTYSGSGTPLKVEKPLTIQGSGSATLDAKGLSSIAENYYQFTDDIVFKDISFVNGRADWYGGAITYATAVDCSFINCSAPEGGAMAYGTARGCIFIECHADNGGALYSVSAYNCQFSRCYAEKSGGAIDGHSLWENNGNYYGDEYKNCKFIGCHASSGGAMSGCDAVNCTFENCYANYGGGMYAGYATGCTFIGCSAKTGSAICGNGISKAINCRFKGNSKPETDQTEITGTIDVNLKLTQSGSYYSDKSVTVEATNDFSGEGVGNLKVLIKFSNGKTATVTTNAKGVATYKVPFNPGTYVATATAYNINEYQLKLTVKSKSNTLTGIKIAKRPVILNPYRLSTTYCSGAYFKTKLIDSKTKNPVAKVKLNFRIYSGSKYINVAATTNSNGVAQYSCLGLAAGNHKVIVSIKDSARYSAASKLSLIKVNRANLKLAAAKAVNVFKKPGIFNVVVKNAATGKLMSGVALTVKVYNNGRYLNFNAKTNAKGVASINTKLLSKGSHAVVVIVRANVNYNAAAIKSSIMIVANKIKTYMSDYGRIAWHYASDGLNDGVVIYPKLTDSYGRTLNKKVYVTTSGGDTVVGYSGTGIFLGNDFDHDFFPLNNGGYAIVRFVEDYSYFGSYHKIVF